MNVIVTKDFCETCDVVAKMFFELISAKPDAKLGLATGTTAEEMYPLMVDYFKKGKLDYSKVRTVNLDEYVGIPKTHEQSYRASMDRWLFDSVNIDKENTFVFDAQNENEVPKTIEEFYKRLYEGGNIDLQLLGIGANGHVGFNEANADFLTAGAHKEALTPGTINANARFFDRPEDVPTSAITMGLRDILSAKKIVLAAFGKSKAEAISGLLSDDNITTKNPATFLKLHHNVTVVIDRGLAGLAGYKG